MLRFLPLLMLPLVGFAQTNSNGEMPMDATTTSEKQPLEIKRNAQYNLEEIKVRWKKAALENCAGSPCSAITVPGAPTGVVATVGNTSVSVAFVAPTNNGGRAITSYTVTSNPATSPVTGTSSPINVTGLTSGTTYTFTVVATNEIGNSVASSASTAVKSFICGTTISDIDGNSYPTVLIGTQCWTQTNLKVTKYNDGTAIPLDASGGLDGITGGQTWTNLTTGAYTIYENLTSNAVTNGFLYNWYAASDSKKICPAGWHVPSEKEFDSLILFIDPSFGSLIVSGEVKKLKVKAPSLWSIDDGTDDFGFSALPSGFRIGDVGQPAFNGKFAGVTLFAHFWTVTKIPGNVVTRRLGPVTMDYLPDFKSAGNSIRCLKD